jgi:phosphoribosylformimino-5-aminoimidazole carboxamide ribotide isomerase
MRVVGVLDLMRGQVVRGVAGRREEYRPVVSRLTTSSQPLAVARALREHLGLMELYVADIDAIMGLPPTWATYAALQADGFNLWVDAGVRDAATAVQLAEQGIASVVIGLETMAAPKVLAEAAVALGPRLVFSLDLWRGAPIKTSSACPEDLAEQAIACGVRRLLVLDLTRVGVGTGTGTEALCAALARKFPEIEIAAGGGVRGRADLERLRDLGVQVTLVASALHDGRLTRPELGGL